MGLVKYFVLTFFLSIFLLSSGVATELRSVINPLNKTSEKLIKKFVKDHALDKKKDFREALDVASFGVYKAHVENYMRDLYVSRNLSLQSNINNMAKTPLQGYLFRSIAVDSESSANDIWGLLQQGESFGVLSRKYSNEPWAEDGGPLGWGTILDLGEDMTHLLANAKLNEISHPVYIDKKWRIVQLLDVKTLEPPPRSIVERALTDDAVSVELEKLFPGIF